MERWLDYRDDGFTAGPTERGILVGVSAGSVRQLIHIGEWLGGLALVADTAGIKVVGRAIQHLNQIDPATYIGSGKAEEIREEVASLQADVVIFDDELSPRHQRELEKAFGDDIKIIDRSALILDIFAQHANTREGALQVELAQLEYRLPRLTRQWTHLARQTGRGGGRGGSGWGGFARPRATEI